MHTRRRFSVLVVDDAANLRALVRLVLELHGPFDVIAEASNGAEAIERAGELEPDLVLLDVTMPVLDGLDALPRVLTASPGSRVVVLSALEERLAAARALEGGASAYLVKGLDPETLVRRLVAVMGEEPNGEQAA